MKRCSLCGGRLDLTKRCTFCGLDNTKNDNMYNQMVNRNNCESKPLTHVHEEPVKVTPKKVANKPSYTPVYQAKKAPVRKVPVRKTTNTVEQIGCMGSIFKLIPIIIVAIGILSSLFSDMGFDEQDYFVGTEEIEVLPEEWEEEGYYYSVTLEEGSYMAGYDIPAGRYVVTTEGSQAGILKAYDTYGDQVFYGQVGEGEEYQLFLYNEYELVISEGAVVSLVTDNAQSLLIE